LVTVLQILTLGRARSLYHSLFGSVLHTTHITVVALTHAIIVVVFSVSGAGEARSLTTIT